MKKLVLLGTAVAVAGYLGTVAYLNQFDKRQAETLLSASSLQDPQQRAVAQILYKNGCQYCHTPSAELPAYKHVPGISGQMRQDIAEGNRVFRLDRLFEGMQDPDKLSEADLAKLERVLLNDEMPISSFLHLHWGSRPDEEEKAILFDWIHAQRAAHFLPKLVEGADAARFVQPIPDKLPTDPAQVALGEKLYHDTRLSKDGTVSCHSCHQLDKGGADGLATSTGIYGQKGGINAPTVFNAAFNKLQFWDGRAKDLADQASGPPLNPVEMGSDSWEQILAKFLADEEFKAEFLSVYPEISQQTLTHAIAEFEKTLITPNSPFDRYLKGDKTALNDSQIRGYQLFQQHKCDTCHTGTALGGQSFEYMGLYGDYFAARGTPLTEADEGRYAKTKDPSDMHKFKVPTLRNVALTAPYMHDARTDKLDEAVRIMLQFQSGSKVVESEVQDITNFLHSLTGELHGKSLAK
ncbi:cytochrome c peroxidase [Mesocricetibacter intestinalis]|uniref:Cytochrome c peroxidase n=1 Tax=Mesocricetibacter intestinalis TaxID=1521930 RepID=A0A4R6V9Z0_9PAST|nr:cytochrome c peroxidase [Mesocricetibacter intestinalis]TDQ56493.1 cytochrome c peroxidase [Mesocricetibacter intestinalis]